MSRPAPALTASSTAAYLLATIGMFAVVFALLVNLVAVAAGLAVFAAVGFVSLLCVAVAAR